MGHYCTYFDKAFILHGLALYRSLCRHAGHFTLYVLCLDSETYRCIRGLNKPNLVPISLQELEQFDRQLLAVKDNRSRVEYYFTCTPCLPLFLLRKYPTIASITYLDADLYFFSSPELLDREFCNHSILIVGHRFPEETRELEIWGVFNVGLVGFRNDKDALKALEWWRLRCLEWCYRRLEDGKYADQKYLDQWPTKFNGVGVVGHDGMGLAPWNVARYRITQSQCVVCVDSKPLIFYHFHALRQVFPGVFDTGFGMYGHVPDDLVLRAIYVPYLRDLALTGRWIGRKLAMWPRPFEPRSWLRMILYGRLFAYLGPCTFQFSLGELSGRTRQLCRRLGLTRQNVKRLLGLSRRRHRSADPASCG